MPMSSSLRCGAVLLAGLLTAGNALSPLGEAAAAGRTSVTRLGAHPPGGDGPAVPGVRTGPLFNVPSGGAARRDAIADQISRLVAGASAGSTISVAMYHFESRDTAAELVAASRRNVRVRVVLDHESAAFGAYGVLRRGLGGDTRRPSWVVLCPPNRGCIGPDFNHNKFYLFSTTLGTADVVVQTSANATDGARDTQWNDALTIADAGVYAAYLGYFGDLAARRPRPTTDYHRGVQAGKYRLDFFPWATGDPISQALDKVSCAGGTRIRVSLGFFTWGPIASRLWRLDDAGCRVQVLFDRVGRVVIYRLTRPGGRNGNPEIRYLSERTGGRLYTHSKYLLIDGEYAGRPQKVVFAGSNNYTAVGFHGHDESMITVADAALEQAYAADFDSVFAHATAVRATDPSSVPAAVLDDRTPNASE